MPMKGFDPEFADLPDYIVKITERIWEGRGVGLIRDWYAEDCVVHTAAGSARGVPAVIAATLDALHAFPDRRLLPEDVIWSGDDQRGYLSSHRVSTPGTHLGDGVFGPPTGRPVHFYAIADCFCVGNRIVEEWLVRDQAGIARQLGLDPAKFAARLAAEDAAAGREPWHLDGARRLREEGALRPPEHRDHPAARLVRDAMHAIWNEADLRAIRTAYHPAAVSRVTGAQPLLSWADRRGRCRA